MLYENYAPNRSGIFVPERLNKRPIAIDLFCGCGGFSLGFMQAGFEVVAGLDFDYHGMITYLHNLGSYPVNIHFIDPEDREKVNAKMERDMKKLAKENGGILQQPISGTGWISGNPDVPGVSHFFYGDIRKITGQEILDVIGLEQGDVDCVMGGPPCQGFSRAGKQDVMDPRNSLVFEFAEVVCDIKPKTFIFENVPGILSMVTPEGVPVMDALCRIFEDGGFGTWDAIKKSLMGSSGAGVAMRGAKDKKTRKAGKGKSPVKSGEPVQASLF